MPSYSISRWITVVIIWIALANALQVTPGSTCAEFCLDRDSDGNTLNGNSSSTKPSDIVCSDVEYYSTATGNRFRKCIDCLQNSNKVDGNENDVSWFLYNIRYAVNVCLFGFPNATAAVSSPCNMDLTCRPLQSTLKAGNLDPTQATEFQYCAADRELFKGHVVRDCVQCLQTGNEQAYLSNFVTALSIGCQQQPAPGTLLGLSGSVFSKTPVNVTTPPEPLPGPAQKSTGMTVGAVVGIAVGAALVFLGGVALFIVHWRRQRRHKQYEEMGHGPHYRPKSDRSSSSTTSRPSRPHPMADYKMQMRPYESTIDPPRSITSNRSTAQTQRLGDYTNNGDYYDRLAEEFKAGRRPSDNVNQMGLSIDHAKPGVGLPTHPAYIPRHLRPGSRMNSPQPDTTVPPPVRKPQKPDSYAIQAYLNAVEETTIPPPPPNPPSQTSHPRSGLGLSPPPPPPPQSKTPSLILPSVPRVRAPKKYTPPKIQIEEASPIAGPGQGPQISMPIPRIENDRFGENRDRSQSRSSSRGADDGPMSDPQDRIVQHTFRMNPSQGIREVPIASGISRLYG